MKEGRSMVLRSITIKRCAVTTAATSLVLVFFLNLNVPILFFRERERTSYLCDKRVPVVQNSDPRFNSSSACKIWIAGNSEEFSETCSHSGEVFRSTAPGYAVEWAVVETFESRRKSHPEIYPSNKNDAHIVFVVNKATALLHCFYHEGNQINPEAHAHPHILQVLEKTNISCPQRYALVHAHDVGRWNIPNLSKSTILSIQVRGDYEENMVTHSTIVIPPFGYLRDPKPRWEGRSHAVFFAGTIWYDKPTYSFGLRQKGVELYHNSTLVHFLEIVEDYQERLSMYRFCLYIPGWASWSHRLFDLVERGCVPVIVFDRSVMPLEHIIAWNEASVFVSEEQFLSGELADIIFGISDEQGKSLFEGIMRIRKFLYRERGTGVGYTDKVAEILEGELCRLYRQRPIPCTEGH